jgi:hypothetical protein
MGQADGLSLAPALPRPASAALVTANKPLRGGGLRLRGLVATRPSLHFHGSGVCLNVGHVRRGVERVRAVQLLSPIDR